MYVAQLVECLLLGSILALYKLSIGACTYNPKWQQEDQKFKGILGHRSEIEARLGHKKPCLKGKERIMVQAIAADCYKPPFLVLKELKLYIQSGLLTT